MIEKNVFDVPWSPNATCHLPPCILFSCLVLFAVFFFVFNFNRNCRSFVHRIASKRSKDHWKPIRITSTVNMTTLCKYSRTARQLVSPNHLSYLHSAALFGVEREKKTRMISFPFCIWSFLIRAIGEKFIGNLMHALAYKSIEIYSN